MKKIIYDGKGTILGRLGSYVSKDLLKGNEVVIINSEKVIISGNKLKILEDIRSWKNLGGKGLKGPKVSRLPDLLVKRMLRGMLPWNRKRGRDAYKRLRCFVGNGPLKEEELKDVKKIKTSKPLRYLTIEEVSRGI